MKRKTIGQINFGLGFVQLVYACLMDVTTGSGVDIVNLDRLNYRLCLIICAASCSIIGALFVVFPERNKTEGEDEEQKQLLLSQLNMLGSIAGKLEVPVNEINEVMEPYGVTFEA